MPATECSATQDIRDREPPCDPFHLSAATCFLRCEGSFLRCVSSFLRCAVFFLRAATIFARPCCFRGQPPMSTGPPASVHVRSGTSSPVTRRRSWLRRPFCVMRRVPGPFRPRQCRFPRLPIRVRRLLRTFRCPRSRAAAFDRSFPRSCRQPRYLLWTAGEGFRLCDPDFRSCVDFLLRADHFKPCAEHFQRACDLIDRSPARFQGPTRVTCSR